MEDVRSSAQHSLLERVYISVFQTVNKHVPWYKLPSLIGAFNLGALRIQLRSYNLYDGYVSAAAQGNPEEEPMNDARYLNARHSDGKFNSLEMPLMGCSGMRLGRNFPRKYCQKPTEDDLMTPNPRVVSERFMARKDRFIPATTLNLLAAAWVQFQTHDWFVHEQSNEHFDVPLPHGDDWGGCHMVVPKTKPDDILDPSDAKCPGYRNMNTAWWDGSQIYGSTEAVTASLRGQDPDGKLLLTEESGRIFLPQEHCGGKVKTGFSDNWWIGLELLHTLFALEHNAICDMLRKQCPSWTGDEIFDKARLINCALMAKIHTIEWTPAILGHPALQIGMNANWWGLAGEKLTKLLGRISKTSEIISGVPGSGVDQDGIPYSLTEEFVSVYRMHSLIPDNIAIFNATSGSHKTTVPLPSVAFSKSRSVFADHHHHQHHHHHHCGDGDGGEPSEPGEPGASFADVFYSFGINYPGAITNNNYPDFLRDLRPPLDGVRRDMGTVDILRDRERGVPRYCAFRRMLRLRAPATFEELTGGNRELAAELEEVYGGDIEKVDSLVGSHSEPVIPGFGFSETAFFVFIVMATRRLKSDRFIAGQWNKETYTKDGLKWVQNTTMKDILVRHFPELEPMLKKSKNVFAPWTKLSESEKYGGVETNVIPG